MVLDRIEVEGFGSYHTAQSIDFGGRGPVAIVGDNGAGKSTLVSKALAWGLHGKTAPDRMGSGTGMLKGKALMAPKAKLTSVKVTLRDLTSGRVVIVERRREKGSGSTADKLMINGVRAEQVEVDQLIGADYDVFVRTVLRGQGDPWNWAEATDARKREILDEVSGARDLERPYERAKSIARTQREVITVLEASLRETRARVDANDPKDLIGKGGAWRAAQDQAISAAEAELRQLSGLLSAAETTDAASTPAQTQRDALAAKAPVLDLQPYQQAEQQAEGIHRDAAQRHAVLNAQANIAAQVKPHEPCPTCGQIVQENADAVVRAKALAAQAAQAAKTEGEAEAHHAAATKAHQDARMWLDAERRKHTEALAQITVTAPQAPSAKLAVDQCRAKLEALRTAVNPWEAALTHAGEQHRAALRDLAVTEELLVLARSKQGIAQAWVDTLNPKGVRAQLAMSALAAIETEANRWLQVLSNGTMTIAFPATKTTGKGVEKQEIQTTIMMDGEARDLLTFSGGERRRVNLAVDLGLASVFAQGGALALSLLVLDEEVFSGLDEQGKASAAQALHEAGVADVVVIDHDPRLSGVLPRTVRVTKGPRGSIVQEE